MATTAWPGAAGDQEGNGVVLRLTAPNGQPIIGTLETLPARSHVLGFTRRPGGGLEPAFTGQTDVFWDDQTTARTGGGVMLVLDATGQAWPITACAVDGAVEPG